MPGGNFGSAFGPNGPLASTYQLTPGEDFFRQGILGSSMPGATLGRAMGYTGPGGPLNSLFSLNPQSQGLYDQGMKGYSSMLDPTGGVFHNYLTNVLGPTITNNETAMGMGRSGASLEALANAGSNAAMQYASLFPQLAQAGVTFGQTPQNLQIQGLTSMGLPLAMQDQANLNTGYQAAGVPRTMAQQYGLQNQNLLYSMLTGLPFPTGSTQTGTGQLQNNQNVLSSFLAPALSATALGLAQNGGTGFANLGSSLMGLGRSASNGVGNFLNFGTPTDAGAASALSSFGQAIPEGVDPGLIEQMLSMGDAVSALGF